MFKFILTFITFITLTASTFASDTLLYTADLSADGQAVTGKSNFYGAWIVTDGTNDVTFSIYDGTSTAGTKIIPTTVIDVDNGTAQTISINPPIICNNGIYIDITTAGTVTFKVYYNKIIK